MLETMTNHKVILVDKDNKEIGVGEKLKIHQEGKLHRAFSIFIFNSKEEILLQKRDKSKYHSPSLWSNTCCSHPQPNEDIKKEAKERLKEEMGFQCDLKELFNFTYKAKLGELTEHEIDHVFLGEFNGDPVPNENEVEDWKWISPQDLKEDIKANPQNYTFWFKLILDRVLKEKSYE